MENCLIVLDLNGVLVHRPSSKKTIVRENARQFILNLSQRYSVAIWSSALLSNIHKILAQIMTKEDDIKSISFILSQKDCEIVRFIYEDTEKEKIEKIKKPKNNERIVLLKNLSTIHDMFPKKFTKVLFIDDSLEKMINNPKDSYHIVDTWNITKKDSFFLTDLEIYIDEFMKYYY